MRTVSAVDIEIGARPCSVTPWRSHGLRVSTQPVIAGLEGAPCVLHLRITEDVGVYDVMAEFDDRAGTTFDVEVDGNRVYIVIIDDGISTQPGAADNSARPLAGGAETRSRHNQLALDFQQRIDATASCGEYNDGLLHLSLRKQNLSPSADAPLDTAARADGWPHSPRPQATP